MQLKNRCHSWFLPTLRTPGAAGAMSSCTSHGTRQVWLDDKGDQTSAGCYLKVSLLIWKMEPVYMGWGWGCWFLEAANRSSG